MRSCVSSIPVVVFFVATPDTSFFISTFATMFSAAQVGGMPRCFDMPGAAKELRRFAAKQVLMNFRRGRMAGCDASKRFPEKNGPPKLN